MRSHFFREAVRQTETQRLNNQPPGQLSRRPAKKEKEMKDEIRKKIKELIILNGLLNDATDERIKEIAIRFPDEYSDDQAFVEFQEAIAEMIPVLNPQTDGEITLIDQETLQETYIATVDHDGDFYPEKMEYDQQVIEACLRVELENWDVDQMGGLPDFYKKYLKKQ